MRVAFALLIGIVLGGSAIWLVSRRSAGLPTTVTAAETPAVPIVAAAQGRVEGRTENIEVEASIDGVIRTLSVSEGQKVAKGQIIAAIACNDLDYEVRALDAALESARQSRVRLLRGSRDEERRVAEEEVLAARAIADQQRKQNDRMQLLVAKDDVPKQTAENVRRDLDTAEANLRSAIEKQKLVNAGPLAEEVAKADADVTAASQKLQAVRAQQEKCVVRSPISGSVTRVLMREGEAFSVVVPRPIVTIADLSGRRVRAEVDERDLTKVWINQKVRMSAEGYPGVLSGAVAWKAVVMGRKHVISTNPADKADRDVLEALIVPDRSAPPLPLGLRVTVEFLK